MYQHLPLQDPQNITQIWIFGLKIYHLATPVRIPIRRIFLLNTERLRLKKTQPALT
jgi:hypothetical protein